MIERGITPESIKNYFLLFFKILIHKDNIFKNINKLTYERFDTLGSNKIVAIKSSSLP